jgi:undecaprenyl pyrophosphate phosphatase UppP
MNLLKAITTWSNAEFIPLKLAIAAPYLCLGAYFHDFFSQYFPAILTVFVITMVISVSLWLRKMKQENSVERKENVF